MKQRRRLIVFIFGIVVLLIVILILNRSTRSAGENVDTVRVRYGSIRSEVTATGELRAQEQVNIQSQVMGTVERLHVTEGEWVNRGDLLLELDRRSFEANRQLAQARFTQLLHQHTRMESLYARGLVAAESFEASLAALEMARAQLDQAQDQFDKTSIRAPISGTVAKLNIRVGEAVMIGTMNYAGTVLMVLADMSRMQALVQVDETDIVNCALGQPAEVEVDALPDVRFPAKVTRLGYMPVQNLLATAGQQGTDFEVELTLDSTSARLRPGMSVHATIVTAELDSALVVPIQAVGRREIKGRETETVFLVKDGKAIMQPITTGRSSATHIEITSGLNPGDEIIVGPYRVLAKLKEGRRVSAHPVADST